jgi:putative tryptophan/tyrosine transport system substrate-binding protein
VQEKMMWCRAVGCLVTLTLSLLAAPLVAEAQPLANVPRIGWLGGTSPAVNPTVLEAFRHGLREHSWIEGQNLVIEYRWAEGRFERLPDLAAELVRLPVDVIVPVAAPAREDRPCRSRTTG